MKRLAAAAALLVVATIAACATSESSGFDAEEDGGASSSGGSSGTPESGTSSSSSSSSSSSGGDDGGMDAPIDVAPGGNPVGFPCAKPADCQSGDCKAVLAGASGQICVKPCMAQSDCDPNFFCDPATAGATTGSCVPRSPAHCKTCVAHTECGSLSEKCGIAAGDTVKACHVDCTISGPDACPPDYACVDTQLDGQPAKVCRPGGGLSCLDSLGGFCDRVATPQPCSRANTEGTCVGQRACLGASTRYDTCGATAPVCKLTCSTTAPAGCTTKYCPEATTSPQNCGTCGTVCPGLNQQNAIVGCNQPTCTFGCNGETYNVDNNKGNGCEVVETQVGNHAQNTANAVGDRACYDNNSNPNISGRIPSDSETHAGVAGFVASTGSASDYHRIHATGQSSIINPCENNVVLTLQMTGSNLNACYHLHIETNKNTYDCDTDANGRCVVNAAGSSQYDDDTDILVVVSKRNVAGCLAANRDNPTYTVTGHL